MSIKLLEIIRGTVVENTHLGSIAVVNSNGCVLNSVGDANRICYYRSTLKPFQTVAFLKLGIASGFNLSSKDIALISSSHSSEKLHIEIAKNIMQNTGIHEDDLECGIHEPYNKDVLLELTRKGEPLTKVHCNCSGKHLGMILSCKLKGLDTKNYSEMDHPINQSITNIVTEFACIDDKDIQKGISGCGLPTCAVPLKNIARSYANLCDLNFKSGKYSNEQNQVISSMTTYPEIIGGENRLDTILMQNFGDRIIAKFGDDGVYCIGLIGKGVGIALKIEDGNIDIFPPIVSEILLQLNIIDSNELNSIINHFNTAIINSKGIKVGEKKITFNLNK